MAEIPAVCQPIPVRPNVKSHENRGGYDCDFVESPPEAFQTECPVCLQILKEPCLISCCGHKFCRVCIERVKKDDKPCPLCAKQDFAFMRELGLERFLKGTDVWCSYKKKDCKWRGKLGKLEEHLNQNPSLENQLNGCKFVVMECVYECGKQFQRCHISTHQDEQCKKRPYTCNYCQDYASTFEDVTEIHYPQCGKYPVACPNDCDVYKMERQDVEDHLRDKCPLTLVDCPFNYAGCEAQLPRKDIHEHMKEPIHLTLLATVTQRLSIENQRLVEENQELQQNIQKLKEREHQYQESIQKQLITEKEMISIALKKEWQEKEQQSQELLHKQRITDDEIRALKEESHQLKLDFQQQINTSGWPLEFRVKFSKDRVYSPAFYTHPHGYRMCVYVDPEGIGAGAGSHVSISACLMCGRFDDYLNWPFRGAITVQLVNQAVDQYHIEKTIYTDRTARKHDYRVIGSERAQSGPEIHRFQSHRELNAKFLRYGRLIVRVVNVRVY